MDRWAGFDTACAILFLLMGAAHGMSGHSELAVLWLIAGVLVHRLPRR